MVMKLISLKCPNCGAQLQIDAEKEFVFCEHCGTKILIDNEISRMQIDNAEEAGYQFEKGRQRAQSEVNTFHKAEAAQTVSSPKKKKRHTWLWVLGWIFIFPLPLTIILVKKKKLNPILKYGIIGVAWIIYLIFALASVSGGSSETTNNNGQKQDAIATRSPESTIVDSSEPTVITNPSEKDEETIVDTTPLTTNDDNATATPEAVSCFPLDQFFMSLSPDLTRDQVDDLAKQYGLFCKNRNTGAGTYTYRIAMEADIAKTNDYKKGSFVSLSIASIGNKNIKDIKYFNAEKMIVGTWNRDKGYQLNDLNNPQIGMFDVSSAEEIIEYEPPIDKNINLLEELLLSANDEMTEDDIKLFADQHSITYVSRGSGNEKTVAYTFSVADKGGDSGSKITFALIDGKLSRMTYYYYPSNYWDGTCANYYSASYAAKYGTQAGFCLSKTKSDPVYYEDPMKLIEDVRAIPSI